VGSVETITVLITDLVGSTGLETRVGPSAADELRDEHFALLRGAIGESGGRETKNTGDGLIAAFDSASEAVSCAVCIQQRFERRNRGSDEQLLIKVGISVGDATVADDGDYFGMPVIEAARLCDRCSAGQILAKEIVAHLAGGREGHTFKSAGELELKGIPEPLPTVEVAWDPLEEEGPFPLPHRLQEMPPGGFVGRAAERESLASLLSEAAEAKRRLALISGEPGIGKTRLATHTALEARAGGAIVLYGRADEELALPYGPWIEALRHYVENSPEAVLRLHAERHGGELTRLVPSLAERLPDLPPPRETDPDTERYLLWGAVLGIVEAAAGEAGLVLILDDLHWADKPTLQLLKHVLTEGEGLRALMIGTYRESDIDRAHPLTEMLADLHREQGVERIALGGLAEDNIVEIMERAAGHELDQQGRELARELHQETDGNAFYAGELLRHLVESGGIYQSESGRWTARRDRSRAGMPQSVREVVGRRIDRLGDDTHKVLSVAAVIGREFDADLVVAVSDRSEEDLLDLLEQAVAASVLTESADVPGRFSFAHALINHILYEELGTTRRARLHRRVAEALEDMLGADPGARVGELAQHWAKATTTVDTPKAIAYARLSGERALSELAPDEALRWFQQALELQDQQAEVDQAERCDLLIGLGTAQRQAGEPAFRGTLLEACEIASELGDADRAARAALQNNRGIQSAFGEVDQQRFDALDRALELDGFANPARCARLTSLQALELLIGPRREEGRALAVKAIALVREAGDDRALADVLGASCLLLLADADLQLCRALVDELLETSRQIGDPALQFWAAYADMFSSAETGELERADAAGRDMRRIADELGQPTLRWAGGYLTANWQLLRGDIAEAERLAEEALQIGIDGGEPDAFLIYGSQFGTVRFMQGRSEEILDQVEEGAEAYSGMPSWRAATATIYAFLGRSDEAASIVAAGASDRFEHVPRDPLYLCALGYYAEAAALVGDEHAAEVLYETMQPWKDRIIWSGAVCLGYVDIYLGMLAATCGWHERADEHLRIACEVQEQKEMWFWAARAHLGWAEALARRGESEGARAHASRAFELSSERDYGLIETRAAAVIESASVAQP
jgi:class 3 adenylate cyclase